MAQHFAEAQVAEPLTESVSEINIHPWAQLVYAVRTTVVSVHHNVCASLADRFLPAWRQSIGEPVWLLGQRYAVAGDEDRDAGTPEEFAAAWSQITRMTYREGFAPMYRPVHLSGALHLDERTQQYVQLTSDAGWGCMIRVGQMLLSTALKRHHSRFPSLRRAGPLEREFLDDPSAERSPFSIFGFIRAAKGGELALLPAGDSAALPSPTPAAGRSLTQKLPGDWFGPTTISETIAALLAATPSHAARLRVFVNPDGVLYQEEIRELAQATCGELESPRRPEQREPDEGFVLLAEAAAPTAPRPSQPRRQTEFEDVGRPADEFVSAGSFYDVDPATIQQRLVSAGSVYDEVVSSEPATRKAVVSADPGLPSDRSTPSTATSSTAPPRQPPGPLEQRWSNGVLILFPVQLGLDKYINKACVEPVLQYFGIAQSLGAMGGRPRMAHFFVGQHDQGLLYVDPHVVQPAATHVEMDAPQLADKAELAAMEESFRNVPTVQVMPVDQIDSSLSIAFYCASEADLQQLARALRDIERETPSAPLSAEVARPAALRLQEAATLSDDSDVLDWEEAARPNAARETSATSPARGGPPASGQFRLVEAADAGVTVISSADAEVAEEDGRRGCRTVMVPAEEAWSGGGWSRIA